MKYFLFSQHGLTFTPSLAYFCLCMLNTLEYPNLDTKAARRPSRVQALARIYYACHSVDVTFLLTCLNSV